MFVWAKLAGIGYKAMEAAPTLWRSLPKNGNLFVRIGAVTRRRFRSKSWFCRI